MRDNFFYNLPFYKQQLGSTFWKLKLSEQV